MKKGDKYISVQDLSLCDYENDDGEFVGSVHIEVGSVFFIKEINTWGNNVDVLFISSVNPQIVISIRMKDDLVFGFLNLSLIIPKSNLKFEEYFMTLQQSRNLKIKKLSSI